MKTFLFIIALGFNLGLCLYPFSELPPEAGEYSGSKNATSVLNETEEETQVLSYSDFLKSKATNLNTQISK